MLRARVITLGAHIFGTLSCFGSPSEGTFRVQPGLVDEAPKVGAASGKLYQRGKRQKKGMGTFKGAPIP